MTTLFTDIEGSTRLLLQSGDGFTALLETHRELSRARNDLPASLPEPLSHIGGPQRSLFVSLPRAMLSTAYPHWLGSLEA